MFLKESVMGARCASRQQESCSSASQTTCPRLQPCLPCLSSEVIILSLQAKVNEGDDKARDRSALYQALLQGFSVEIRRALCHLAGKPERPLQTLFISQVAFLRFLEAGAPETYLRSASAACSPGSDMTPCGCKKNKMKSRRPEKKKNYCFLLAA